MWCFFDESYPPEGGVTAVVACMMQDATVRVLDKILYNARRKYYGRDHAQDLTKELKGNALLSKTSFRMAAKHGASTNHYVVREVLSECKKAQERHPIYLFGIAVYGVRDILKQIDHRRLVRPFADILNKVSAAAKEISRSDLVNLVFDEQLSAKPDLAMSTRRFVSGVHLDNVSHYPLIAVSHVSPGIQLADIGAYILGRRAAGDHKFTVWLQRVRNLEWSGQVDGRNRMGIQRFEALPSGAFCVRKRWE